MTKTVMQILENAASQYGDVAALRVKRNGTWQSTTYAEYLSQVKTTARAFMKLGLEPGKGVSIIGYNCPEWLIADIGAIFAGGVPAGIYTTNSAEQCQYIADHCEAAIVVVENSAQLEKFKQIKDQLPHMKACVMMQGSDDADWVYSWDELPTIAEDVSAEDLQTRIDNQKIEDCCTLIYTSGTTGPPKAVMITHENISWTAHAATSALDMRSRDSAISYLPLSHIAEQMTSVHGPLLLGATVSFAESIEKLGDNLREIRPHYFLGVPRVWEKIQAKMVAAGAQNPPLRKKIAAWARGLGLEGGYADQRGQSKPFMYGLANKLVFSKVREKLGLDRCRIAVTSAAPISKDTLEFFLSLGIPIMEVYGMSECTGPATVSLPDRYATGKAGFALPGAELKIAEDGEVCMRGKHVFKGYFKNEAATQETIDDDGWLLSGDIGTIDDKGFLQITDRKKELIITAGGENIPPAVIEGQLRGGIAALAQAVVIGDRRKHLSALFTLDSEKLSSQLEAAGSSAKTMAEAVKCPTLQSHIQAQLDSVNSGLARVQTIKKWTLLPSEFTPESGELTPTMKLKRRVINERYAEQIEGMYA
jgi:long-subunit acyl-CoA synthetase (AMP-forming)